MTGIAANLLRGGRTVHSTFKLPIPLTETSVSNVRPTDELATVYKKTALLIWDEISMAPLHAFRAVDALFKDIMNEEGQAFGGIVVLVGGDFRQCLPVVRHGTRTDIIEACVKRSALWMQFQRFTLKENLRVTVDPNSTFADWLLRVGDGRCEDDFERVAETIRVPKETLVEGSDPQQLIDIIFGKDPVESNTMMNTKAILCQTNAWANTFNEQMLHRMKGDTREYLSVDKVECLEADDADIPTEFLNSLTPSGMPPHCLVLKKGCAVMLLRNVDVSSGLCNGTRFIVFDLHSHFLELEFIAEGRSGERVFLPRIQFCPSETDLPFAMTRTQFPVRLCYAMTVNKAQGQSFDKVGVYVSQPTFAHGQLYVAFSRVRSFSGLRVQLSHSASVHNGTNIYTRNCVYKEILS